MAIHTFTGNATEWGKAGHHSGPEDYRVEYEGCVLQTYERNGYDDSDFYAIVWDEAMSSVQHVCYATTRGWTYANGATVDATDEAIAHAQRFMRAADVKMVMLTEQWDSTVPAKGRAVKVIGTGDNATGARRWQGERIEAGSEGTVFWMGFDKYRSTQYRTSYRLGVELADGRKVFGSDEAFEVVNPQQYCRTEDEVSATLPSADTMTNFHRGVSRFANMVR